MHRIPDFLFRQSYGLKFAQHALMCRLAWRYPGFLLGRTAHFGLLGISLLEAHPAHFIALRIPLHMSETATAPLACSHAGSVLMGGHRLFSSSRLNLHKAHEVDRIGLSHLQH